MRGPWGTALTSIAPGFPTVAKRIKSIAGGSPVYKPLASGLSSAGTLDLGGSAPVGMNLGAGAMPPPGGAHSQPQTFTALANGLIPLSTPAAGISLIQPHDKVPGATNPFLRPGNGYGGTAPKNGGMGGGGPQDWYDTEHSREEGEKNPEGEWLTFLLNNDAGGQDRFSNWARSLYSQARAGYSAAQLHNPQLVWRQYLKTLNGTLQNLYAGLTPDQRGVDIPTQTKTIYMG